MTATLPSFNLGPSGVADAWKARNSLTRALYLGDHNSDTSTDQTLYEILYKDHGNLAGFALAADLGFGSAPLARHSYSPSGVAAGSLLHPFAPFGQPNVGTTICPGLFYDVAAPGTGEAGVSLVSLGGSPFPQAANELIWDNTTGPTNNSLIGAWDLVEYDVPSIDSWWSHALTVTYIGHGPATNNTGANPVLGSPSLRVGHRRNGGAETLSATIAASAVEGYKTAQFSIPAGSGPPGVVIAENGGGTANIKRRHTPTSIILEVTGAQSGLTLIPYAFPYTFNSSYSGTDADIPTPRESFFTTLKSLLGSIDLLVYNVGALLSDGSIFADGSSTFYTNDLAELLTNGLPPASWTETINDQSSTISNHTGNGLNTSSTLRILILLPLYSGWGSTLAEAAAICSNMENGTRYFCSSFSDTKYGWSPRAAYVNPMYGRTPAQIAASSYIKVGCTSIPDATGAWSSLRSYTTGQGCISPNSTVKQGNSKWFVATAPSLAVEPGVTVGWESSWQLMDFTYSPDGCALVSSFLSSQMNSAGSSAARAASAAIRTPLRTRT